MAMYTQDVMNIATVRRLQKENGADQMQKMIDSGLVWKMEGSIGREAMMMLESGICFLPKIIHFDYYGNKVPARQMLKAGTKGTFQNAVRYWERHEEFVERAQ
jgi:hypothetical protein